MSEGDSYADIAPYYDLEFDSFEADLELYTGYAQIVGGPILELGCGTGRLLVPLAATGFDIFGLDNSAAMVDLAHKRINKNKISDRVTVARGDMRDLSDYDGYNFRLVFIAVNSFLHLESRNDQLRALREIRRVLDRDGLLVIDVFNPTPDALTRMEDRYAFDAEWEIQPGEVIQRFSQRTLDSAEQVITTRLFYDRVSSEGILSRQTTSYQMRYVHRFELELLLEYAGFEIEGVFGSYELGPYGPESDQLIVVAHRTPNAGEA